MKGLIFVLLFFMSVQDYKRGIVSDYWYLPLIFFVKIKMIVILFFIILLFTFKYIDKYIGGADLKIILIFALIFPFSFIFEWLTLSCFIALLYALILKKDTLKMFPFFFFAFFIMCLIGGF